MDTSSINSMTSVQSRSPPTPRKRRGSAERPQIQPKPITDRHPPSTEVSHVIVIGPQNSGKSTTINSIFGRQLVSSGPESDNTVESNIVQFCSANVRILDTPGLGSSQSNSIQDTKIIATLKKYLDQDIYLRQSIPHVILLVVRFDEPKLGEMNSSFVKTLQTINLLSSRLFSKEYCNLIVLLTHFMDLRKSCRDNPNVRMQLVRNTIRKYLDKSCHIVFGENDAEAWGLRRQDGSHKLPEPTGEIYPKNLIDLISDVIGRSGLMTNVFQQPRDSNIYVSKSLPLVEIQSSRFEKTSKAVNWAYGRLTLKF